MIHPNDQTNKAPSKWII